MIYVLVIDHPKGRVVSLHRTEAAAAEAMIAYCRSNWVFACGGDTPMPKAGGELMSDYFAACEDVWEVITVREPPATDAIMTLLELRR